MSKIRPWLGLYLWMNEERQDELGKLMKKEEVQLRKRTSLYPKLSKSAKIVNISSLESLKSK